MAFPQPLSLELFACQKTSEAEEELEAPSLPQLPFWNWVPLAYLWLFRQELTVQVLYRSFSGSGIMQDDGITECRLE